MKIFVDGSAGTTGLEIVTRLEKRGDLTLIKLSEAERKESAARAQAIRESDLTILCLPDDAAVEAVKMAEGSSAKIIDASTAHRTAPDFVYGFPEIAGQREKIRAAKRVANPGCHASGFIALVTPLVKEGILDKDAPLSCFSLTGYTGGGKKMIREYEEAQGALDAPRQYALTQQHKHLKEMVAVTGVSRAPTFLPVVGAFPRGMQVSVPLSPSWLTASKDRIEELYRDLYAGGAVYYATEEEAFLSASLMAGKDSMRVSLLGNEDRIVAVASFDNLGKGASGAAIQNMNIMLGEDEYLGLTL